MHVKYVLCVWNEYYAFKKKYLELDLTLDANLVSDPQLLKRPCSSCSNKKGFAIYQSQDGKYTYKLGIIDFLTKYTDLKLLENEVKSKYYHVDKMEISAID